MDNDIYFIAKGKHLIVPVTKQEYEDYWNKKRKEPKTNEQWFCSLSTKEKAVVLDGIEHYARECENRHEYSCDNCDCPYCYNYQMDFERWLKEKHKE